MAFDIVQCRVKLAGKPNMIVNKVGITPAHVVVLRRVHGEHSILDLKLVPAFQQTPRMKRRSQTSDQVEFEYLVREFAPHVTNVDDVLNGDNIVESIWPGLYKVLPKKLKDVDLQEQAPAPDDAPEFDEEDLDAVPEHARWRGDKDLDVVAEAPSAKAKPGKKVLIPRDIPDDEHAEL